MVVKKPSGYLDFEDVQRSMDSLLADVEMDLLHHKPDYEFTTPENLSYCSSRRTSKSESARTSCTSYATPRDCSMIGSCPRDIPPSPNTSNTELDTASLSSQYRTLMAPRYKLKEASARDIEYLQYNPSNMNHVSIVAEKCLFGKTTNEMKPKCQQPAVVLLCTFKNLKWRVTKNWVQLKDFDAKIRDPFTHLGVCIPKLPSSLNSTNPNAVHSHTQALQQYFLSLTFGLREVFSSMLENVGHFISTDVIRGSAIYDYSCWTIVKSKMGWKLHFVVQDGQTLKFYTHPGGKLVKEVALYLCSVQHGDSKQKNSLTITEFDKANCSANYHQVVFESAHTAKDWHDRLQKATWENPPTPPLESMPMIPYAILSLDTFGNSRVY